mgnify:CR=1 FL=1
MRILLSLIVAIFFCAPFSKAQSYLTPTGDSLGSFRQAQRNFYQWKQQHDLKKTRGWKSFKRFEQETQLRTNGHGEQDGIEAYLEALLTTTASKANSKAAMLSAPRSRGRGCRSHADLKAPAAPAYSGRCI